MVTKEQLQKIMPLLASTNDGRARLEKYYKPLLDAMNEFEINTPIRMAYFLCQIAHESGQLQYEQEIASGSAYEGRKDLGNTQKGDGKRFKGRGFIQLTGRANYKKAGEFFKVDFISNPEIVATPEYTARVAGWFWKEKDLNKFADKDDMLTITKKINGGTNGLADRKKYLIAAKHALGI